MWSVCLLVCLTVTFVGLAKMAEPTSELWLPVDSFWNAVRSNVWPSTPATMSKQLATGNIVIVEATFDFVATNGNNVERFYCKISSFRQSRNKLIMFNLFRLCRKDCHLTLSNNLLKLRLSSVWRPMRVVTLSNLYVLYKQLLCMYVCMHPCWNFGIWEHCGIYNYFLQGYRAASLAWW